MVAKRIIAAIDWLNDSVGRTVSWLSLLMILISFGIVVLRYVFNLGWIWLQESVVFLHGILFMSSVGYSLLNNQHVRIDIFYRPMSARKKSLINLLGSLFLLLPTTAMIAWYTYPYVRDSWLVYESSKEAGGLPGIFLLKSFILVFAALLSVQGLSEILRSLLVLTSARPTSR